jgi:hypothetical protein
MFTFEPKNFFPKVDPVVFKEENPALFSKTCAALGKGTNSVKKTMSEAISVAVSILKAAAEKAAAEKAAEEAAVNRIMNHLAVPEGFSSNHDNDFEEHYITPQELLYYRNNFVIVKEQDGKYSLSVQTKAGFDICLHNVKITGKGCRWFFAEKITINGKVVAVDFFRVEFGLCEDLIMVYYQC